MRISLTVLGVLALAACEAPDVQTRSGVGFQNYSVYQRQQAYLARSRMAPPPVTAAGPVEVAAAPGTVAPGTVAPGTVAPGMVAEAPVPQTAAAPAQTVTAQPLSSSIGAETLAALGSGTAAPAPAPLGAPMSALSTTAMGTGAPASAPLAPVSASGSNIVAFALSTTNGVGQQVHRRSRISGGLARFERACAGYASDGMAQEAFLERGGPERDPMGLDPDGDGFACRWDPSPFRMIRG